MRYVPYNGGCTMPDWLFEPTVRPRVCVSMGTVPIPEGVDGLAAAVAGLAGLDVEVIVSGAGVHGFGELPANARRIAWIPHHHLLPSCDLFVAPRRLGQRDGGDHAGRPQLVLPQMCDQFAIADRLVDAGVARCVPFEARSATPSGRRPRTCWRPEVPPSRRRAARRGAARPSPSARRRCAGGPVRPAIDS